MIRSKCQSQNTAQFHVGVALPAIPNQGGEQVDESSLVCLFTSLPPSPRPHGPSNSPPGACKLVRVKISPKKNCCFQQVPEPQTRPLGMAKSVKVQTSH